MGIVVRDFLSEGMPPNWIATELDSMFEDPEYFTFVAIRFKFEVHGEVLEETISRIYRKGEILFHSSRFLVQMLKMEDRLRTTISRAGVMYWGPLEGDTLEKAGGFEIIREVIPNANQVLAFKGKKIGDLLRGCRQIQNVLGHGQWTEVFKHKQFEDSLLRVLNGTEPFDYEKKENSYKSTVVYDMRDIEPSPARNVLND